AGHERVRPPGGRRQGPSARRADGRNDPGQRRPSVQSRVPPLPRGVRAEPPRGDDERDDGVCPRRRIARGRADARRHRRRARDAPVVPLVRGSRAGAGPERHRADQPDDPAGVRIRRPTGVLPETSRPPRRVPALLPRAQRRQAAGPGGVPGEHRRHPEAQRDRVRSRGRPLVGPGLQPRRRQPAPASSGVGGRLQARAGRAVRHPLQPAAHDHEHADRPVPARP
ncbi:MAG: hypothetical protein AVDCRST_MAG64-4161, partial [uncultured Phycisphaerae bacterium]